jgi:hypothetical protein
VLVLCTVDSVAPTPGSAMPFGGGSGTVLVLCTVNSVAPTPGSAMPFGGGSGTVLFFVLFFEHDFAAPPCH